MNWDLKGLIDSYVDLFAENGDFIFSIMGHDGIDTSNMEGVIRYELSRFAMYLTCSDGEIKWSEASTIEDYLGFSMTPEDIREHVEEENLYSVEFENTVPLSISMAVEIDNYLYINDRPQETPISETGVFIYKALADEIMSADYDVADSEFGDAQLYTQMLENYVNDNLLERKSTKAPAKKIHVTVKAKKGTTRAPEKK